MKAESIHTTYFLGNRQAEIFEYVSGAGDLWLSIPGLQNRVFTLDKENAQALAGMIYKHFGNPEELPDAEDCFDPFKGTEKY
ncbi:hypothetical protein SEA_NICEHOUSE_181 [Rhodococcus phage NiceHouse]|nr:hypothetical protein SEA_NICEHOUSE_181 [Rhodococcus phage NiceHouse]